MQAFPRVEWYNKSKEMEEKKVMRSLKRTIKFSLSMLVVLVTVLAGAGCQRKNDSANSNQSSTSQSSSSSAIDQENQKSQYEESEQSSVSEVAYWNAEKAGKLADFMVGWGAQMNQTDYVQLGSGDSQQKGDIGQIDYINNNRVAVNEVPVTVEWSTDGNGQADYQIVDSYIYWAENAVNPIFYLFTLQNGKAVVLVSKQNQGNEANLLYTHPTENVDLQNGFASIVESE